MRTTYYICPTTRSTWLRSMRSSTTQIRSTAIECGSPCASWCRSACSSSHSSPSVGTSEWIMYDGPPSSKTGGTALPSAASFGTNSGGASPSRTLTSSKEHLATRYHFIWIPPSVLFRSFPRILALTYNLLMSLFLKEATLALALPFRRQSLRFL